MSYFREELYALFVARHLDLVIRVARKRAGASEEAEDLIQDVLVKIHARLEQALMAENTEGWIVSVVKNQHIDSLRRNKANNLNTVASEESHNVPQDGDATPEAAAQKQSLVPVIRSALNQLSKDHAGILRLVYMDELTVQQCAEQLKVPVGTVKSRLNRAKTALKEVMLEMDQHGIVTGD